MASSNEKTAKLGDLAQQKRPPLMLEFWYFLKHNKKWWLLPILLMLLILCLLVLLGGSARRSSSIPCSKNVARAGVHVLPQRVRAGAEEGFGEPANLGRGGVELDGPANLRRPFFPAVHPNQQQAQVAVKFRVIRVRRTGPPGRPSRPREAACP